jgi:hypothetical protein
MPGDVRFGVVSGHSGASMAQGASFEKTFTDVISTSQGYWPK